MKIRPSINCHYSAPAFHIKERADSIAFRTYI